MSTKRLRKLFMAEGIQRNDAQAFIRTYQKLRFNPLIRRFPELITPQMIPIQTRTIIPQQYAARCVLSKAAIKCGSIDYESYVKDHLSEELAKGLARSGFILFEHKEYAYDVVFTAKVRVLPPEAVKAHTLGEW